MVSALVANGEDARVLVMTTNLPALGADRWTAAVLLFHDHDWEGPILSQLLETDAFYIGAMGSRAAHQARCDDLRSRGIADEQIARIQGPIGLIPSMRDPETLAVSVLAELIDRYNTACLA
jgi:xanthine dehydrogenase accessory factor